MKRTFSYVLFGLMLLSLTFPFVMAAASASPGSTTTIMGMPVVQNFSGLEASEAYDIYLYSPGTNVTVVDDAYADSDGDLSVTITDFNDYGNNYYVLERDSIAKVPQLTFSINNMDVIPYLLPVIIIAVIFSLMRAFKF